MGQIFPTDFFEGFRQRYQVKRDSSVQVHRGVGNLSINL